MKTALGGALVVTLCLGLCATAAGAPYRSFGSVTENDVDNITIADVIVKRPKRIRVQFDAATSAPMDGPARVLLDCYRGENPTTRDREVVRLEGQIAPLLRTFEPTVSKAKLCRVVATASYPASGTSPITTTVTVLAKQRPKPKR